MMQKKIKKILALATMIALHPLSSTLAQQGTGDGPRTPTPRLADGTVDLGGWGFWDQPYITDFARRMPNYKEGDLPPMLPWTRAMWEYNRATDVAYDPQGFCLIPGGPRAMATPYPSQFIQDGRRIIIIFEGGGHVWREIFMDGRPLPELGEANPTYFGHAVGRWEGDTLVVMSRNYNEKTWLDFGGRMHTNQLQLTEYFSRPYKEVLQYRAVIDDPGAYYEPWEVSWEIPWVDSADMQEYVCQENNQYMFDLMDDYGEPFFKKSNGID
jgi:hypothetical protein